MALHVSATGSGRLCALLARAASLAEGGAGGTCPPRRPVPPCPPCRAAPQPACRARPASVRRAQRVVCCAPPQGARPPCAPPRPACSLTCRDYLEQIREHRAQDELLPLKESGGNECEQDPVAKRLSLAKRARRADYLRDVVQRAERSRRACAPPAAPYCLGSERECARATDGCLYMMPRVTAPPPRCGPGRTPPPPRCVELAPDDGCRIKGDAHLDPCAHRPRVMIEIDRSANCTASPPPPPATPCRTGGGGRSASRAGDTGWCASPPPAAPAPQPCRRPTIVERLRARSVPRLPSSQNERRLHTSADLLSKARKPIRSRSGGLDNLINSKLKLKEAGLGRVVVDTDEDHARQTTSLGGSLEMCVPVGTERVTVLVSLDGASAGGGASACGGASAPAVPAPAAASCSTTSPDTSCAQRSSLPRNCFTTVPEQRDSWLSIKKLQKKLTGGRCGRPTTELKGEPTPVSSSQRCDRSTSSSTQETKQCSSVSTFLANTT